MKKYTTIVFDLDGTLLNTLEDLTNSVNYALSQMDYPVRALDEVRFMVGNGVRTLMERAVPAGICAEAFEKCFALFKEYYDAHCNDNTRPYARIPELLHALKERGYRLAIVSNKIDHAVKALQALYFQDVTVALGEKENLRRKPAPDMVHAALKELQVPAAEAVYIGDSDVDIQTAVNSGLDCISVSWGFRDTAFLQAHGATTIIRHPEELLSLLD